MKARRHTHKDTKSCWRLHTSCWCQLVQDIRQVTEINTFFPPCTWLFLSIHFPMPLFYNLELMVIKSYKHITHTSPGSFPHCERIFKCVIIHHVINTECGCHLNKTCSIDTKEWSQKQSLQWTHPMKYNGSITDPNKLQYCCSSYGNWGPKLLQAAAAQFYYTSGILPLQDIIILLMK